MHLSLTMLACPLLSFSACSFLRRLFLFFILWLWLDGNHYLIDVFRERCDYPTLRARIIEMWDRHRPERALIEDTGSGTGVISRSNLAAIEHEQRTQPCDSHHPRSP